MGTASYSEPSNQPFSQPIPSCPHHWTSRGPQLHLSRLISLILPVQLSVSTPTQLLFLPSKQTPSPNTVTMSANKTSAVSDEPIDVLVVLHPKFDLLDMAGPVEVFTTALHNFKDPSTKAFEITTTGAEPKVLSEQGIIVGSQIPDKEAQPFALISDFSELQKKDPARERTILSVCTGSLFLAKEGILSGLSATTHPDY